MAAGLRSGVSDRTPAQPHPWDLLFGRWSVAVGVVVLAGGVAGASIPGLLAARLDLCWFHLASGLPCPGCGLTRSVVCLFRGQWAASLAFHPFGVLVLPWALVSSSSLIWPGALQRRSGAWLALHREGFRLTYSSLIFAFVVFGVLRLALVGLGVLAFP
jgi:hypothetical protein